MKGVVKNSFKLNLTVMKMIGLYPFEKHTRFYTFYSYVLYIFAMLPGSFLGFVQLFFQKDSDGVRYDDLISMVMIFLSPKLFSIVINGHNIKKCIHYFDGKIFVSQSENRVNIVEDCVKVCQRNSNVFFIGCVVSIISWCGNLFFRKHQLPLNVWLPSSLRESSVCYYCLYINLVIGVTYVGLACATVDPLIAGLICHASGQLQVLKENLQFLDKHFDKMPKNLKIDKSQFIYDKIKQCVVHYSAIVSFVDEYERSFSSAIFCQFLESVIVIGICCLQISKMQDFNINFLIMINYLCFLLLQVYFYCYYGTTLIDENNSLTNAIYMSNWYKYNKKSKKALIILMERSKKPLTVTAGKILDLSLETFMLILKRSYSLLAVLKNY